MSKLLNQLEIVPINQLIPHESIQDYRFNKLMRQIESDNMIMNPLPCVKKDDYYFILDGHHRYFSAKQLGCRFMPIQIVKIEDVTVKYWLHEMQEIPLPENATDNGNYVFAKSRTHQYTCQNNADAIYDKIWHLYRQYQAKPYKRELIWCEQDDYIQYTGLTWELVYQFAKNKQMLPPCVTRFVLPLRMLNIDMPLHYLKQKTKDLAQKYVASLADELMFSEPTISLARPLDVNKIEEE